MLKSLTTLLLVSILYGCATSSESPAPNVALGAKQWQEASTLLSEDPPKTEKGRKLLRAAAENGNPAAMNEIGYGYLWGEYGLPQDLSEARGWLYKALPYKDHMTYYNLADSYRLNSLATADEPNVSKWLELAALGENPCALFEFGFRLIEGFGTARDVERGRAMIKRAAAIGYSPYSYIVDSLEREHDVLWLVFDGQISKTADSPDSVLESYRQFVILMSTLIQKKMAGEPTIIGTSTFNMGEEELVTLMFYALRAGATLGDKGAQRFLAELHEAPEVAAKFGEPSDYWRQRAGG